MPVKICPRCQKRILFDKNCEDYVHECNSGNKTLDEEDIKVIGKWEDYTGSGGQSLPLWQGIVNRKQGQRAGIEGEDDNPETVRGNNKNITRQRKHLEFIKLD